MLRESVTLVGDMPSGTRRAPISLRADRLAGDERSLQHLAKSRRDYLAQVRMLTVDQRTQEAAMINKALGIKAPKGAATAATLDAARAAYIRLLGSPGSNAEIKAEVTCFCEQLDQMQLRMLGPKPRKASDNILRVNLHR